MDLDAPSRRRTRAVGVIAISLVAIAVVAIVYAAPRLRSPTPAPANLPPVQTKQGESVTYDFLTPSLGWAAATSGTDQLWVYETTDGAKHWRMRDVLADLASNKVSLLDFPDSTHGFIAVVDDASQAPSLYRTSDAGGHWQSVGLPDGASSVTFSDALNGWVTVVGETSHTFATSDAGRDWSRLPDAPTPFADPVFRGPAEAWLDGDPSFGPPEVFSSVDGGMTWQAHLLPQPPAAMASSSALRAAHPAPLRRPAAGQAPGLTTVTLLPGTGVVVQLEPACTTKSSCAAYGPTEFVSLDMGLTWSQVSVPPGGVDYGAIAYQDAHVWWAIQNNSLWKSVDSGRTWGLVSGRIVYDHLVPNILDAKHAWVQMRLINDATSTQRSFTTTELDMTYDGGLHWSAVTVPVPVPG